MQSEFAGLLPFEPDFRVAFATDADANKVVAEASG
jgi:hypothetical protein